MDSDDLVGRVHQQAQRTHEMGAQKARAQFREWSESAHRLLSGTRGNLARLVERKENALQPLFIEEMRAVGRGRKKKIEHVRTPATGWKLRSWEDENGAYHARRRCANYLLHDGRLLTAVLYDQTTAGTLLPDSAFPSMLAVTGIGGQVLPVLETLRWLFSEAGLPQPIIGPIPRYDNQGYTSLSRPEWARIKREEIGGDFH